MSSMSPLPLISCMPREQREKLPRLSDLPGSSSVAAKAAMRTDGEEQDEVETMLDLLRVTATRPLPTPSPSPCPSEAARSTASAVLDKVKLGKVNSACANMALPNCSHPALLNSAGAGTVALSAGACSGVPRACAIMIGTLSCASA